MLFFLVSLGFLSVVILLTAFIYIGERRVGRAKDDIPDWERLGIIPGEEDRTP